MKTKAKGQGPKARSVQVDLPLPPSSRRASEGSAAWRALAPPSRRATCGSGLLPITLSLTPKASGVLEELGIELDRRLGRTPGNSAVARALFVVVGEMRSQILDRVERLLEEEYLAGAIYRGGRRSEQLAERLAREGAPLGARPMPIIKPPPPPRHPPAAAAARVPAPAPPELPPVERWRRHLRAPLP